MPTVISIDADGYHFDFYDAISAYIFDEKSPTSPNFHGGFMKAVDIIAEFKDKIFFIEMKDYRDEEDQFVESEIMSEEEKKQARPCGRQSRFTSDRSMPKRHGDKPTASRSACNDNF